MKNLKVFMPLALIFSVVLIQAQNPIIQTYFTADPALYYVKLNEDMISYDRSIGKDGIVTVDMTAESFGSKAGHNCRPGTNYTEGPWLYKRNDLYYMVYAAAGIPEYIAYSTAPAATGPWTYQGYIMERADHLAFTNHPGIFDYKGNSYFFYHTHELSGGEGFKHSVSIEQFEYNAVCFLGWRR